MIKVERQQQVLNAAKAVFSEKGFHNASIADIIRQAGIARGTFYLYFESKQQIFAKLLDYLLDDIDQRISTIEVGPEASPPLAQLRQNLTRVISLAVDEPHLIHTLLHHASGQGAELDSKLDDFYDRVIDRIEWALKLGTAMGLVRPCQTRWVAYSVLGSIKEVMGRLAAHQLTPLQVDDIVTSLLSFGLHGVLVEKLDK